MKKYEEDQLEKLSKEYDEKLDNYKIDAVKGLTLCKFEAKQAEEHCREIEGELEDIKFELIKREQDVEDLVKKLEEKTKECEVSKEKLSAARIEMEKIPENSILGECFGGIVDKENEELREKIKQLELALLKEKAVTGLTVHCPENSLDCKTKENSISNNMELPSSFDFCEKSESVINVDNLKKSEYVCDINKQDSISLSSRGSTEAAPFTLNNLSPVKNDCVGVLWQQYNDSMTENGCTNEVIILEKCVNKVITSLQKFETEFPKQINKFIKITSRANGSNGLVSLPDIKELMEDVKSVKKSLLCLSQALEKSDVKLQKNNSISKSSEVTNGKDCNSNLAINSICDTFLKKEEELPGSVASQDSAALLEKIKEFNILNEQYLTTAASLHHKEKELNVYKKKYLLEKRENLQNVKFLRESEIKCQKLQLELKDVRKTEIDLKKIRKKEKINFKLEVKEMREKYSKLYKKYFTLQTDIENLNKKNQKLQDDVISYRTRNEELNFHVRFLENQIEELGHRPKSQPEQSTNIELETRVIPYTQGPKENHAELIPKTEILSPSECETSSLNTEIEGNITASALYTKNLQNPFHLHTADEESFLNHSSIAGLSKHYESEDSLNRVQELNRRNTMCTTQFESYIPRQNHEDIVSNRVGELNRRNTFCKPHLQSCYPAEGVPLYSTNKHSSKYVDFKNVEDAKKVEFGNKEPIGKKRKMSEMKKEDESLDVVSTPSRKTKTKFKTPSSLHRLLRLSRNRRTGNIKPKPN